MSAADTTPASGVFAPAAKLTTERAKLPVTGKPPESALATFAAHACGMACLRGRWMKRSAAR